MKIEYAQGFIASRAEDLNVPSHYQFIGELGGYKVFQDDRVPFHWIGSATARAVVLGFAGNVADDRTAEELLGHALAEEGPKALELALDSLAGRWAVLSHSPDGMFAYHDAIAARSVFYAVDGSLVASHVGLIVQNLPEDESAPPLLPVTQNYTLDLSEHAQVRALLPNFRLQLGASAQVERIFPVSPNELASLPVDELVDLIEKLWKAGSAWALSLPFRQLASLTAGFDSRLLAAMQDEMSSDLEYYTYRMHGVDDSDGYSARTWNEDARTGARIASLCGMRHHIVEFGGDVERDGALRRQLLTNSPLGHGLDLAEAYLRRYGEMTTVLHRSSAMEIGREYFASAHFVGTSVQEAERLLETEFHKDPGRNERPESTHSAISRYLGPMGLRRATELGYSATSLIFWEFRVGRFHSDVLTGMDAAFIPINPFSTRTFWKAMLALPYDLRSKNWLHYELVARNRPELNALPVNGENVFGELGRQHFKVDEDSGSVFPRNGRRAPFEIRTGRQGGGDRRLDSARPNVAFLERANLESGSWAGFEGQFTDASGGIELVFRSQYSIGRASNCLRVELWLNDVLLVHEDLGYSAQPVRAHLAGLQRGDRISLRVASLRSLPPSWEGASRLELIDWSVTRAKSDVQQTIGLGWSSPWGVRVENEEILSHVD